MMKAEALKDRIRAVFAGVEYPGDQRLRGSDEGDEPFEVEAAFQGRHDWRALEAEFIDRAPDGLASALSFFSHAAFRFYLPAYLIADIEGRLERVDPVFQLTHGLDDRSRGEQINPLRHGEMVWFDYAHERFQAFTREEAAAVVAYLTYRRDLDECQRDSIDEAIRNYWQDRAK